MKAITYLFVLALCILSVASRQRFEKFEKKSLFVVDKTYKQHRTILHLPVTLNDDHDYRLRIHAKYFKGGVYFGYSAYKADKYSMFEENLCANYALKDKVQKDCDGSFVLSSDFYTPKLINVRRKDFKKIAFLCDGKGRNVVGSSIMFMAYRKSNSQKFLCLGTYLIKDDTLYCHYLNSNGATEHKAIKSLSSKAKNNQVQVVCLNYDSYLFLDADD